MELNKDKKIDSLPEFCLRFFKLRGKSGIDDSTGSFLHFILLQPQVTTHRPDKIQNRPVTQKKENVMEEQSLSLFRGLMGL